MHPILFKIGTIEVPAYGALLVVSFLLAAHLLKRGASKHGLDPEKTADVAIAALLFGLVGAKLLLLIVDPGSLAHPLQFLRSAGVVFGGLIFGSLGVIWYLRRKKLPFWKTLDCLAPFTALAMGLGRLSCLMAGCCYGIPYEGPLALYFPDNPYCDAPTGVGLFPTQPLGLINGVVLFAVLLFLLRRRRFDGQVIVAFAFLYSLTRGLLEFLRGDQVRGLWFDGRLSTSQIIAILGLAAAGWFYWKLPKDRLT